MFCVLDQDENYVYLVLELCENGELARFLKQSATLFSENEARTVFQQVLLILTQGSGLGPSWTGWILNLPKK